MLTSRVEGLARQNSLGLLTTADPASVTEVIEQGEVRILLVDLQCPGVDIANIVAAVRKATPHKLAIVAFGPHVHEARLAAANDAGCDFVLSRGQFDRQASALLRELID